MADFFIEFLKISLGIFVGGVFSTSFKLLKFYNCTQISILKLDQKFDSLSQNLVSLNKFLIDCQVKTEALENELEAIDRRLFRLENLVEPRQRDRYLVE